MDMALMILVVPMVWYSVLFIVVVRWTDDDGVNSWCKCNIPSMVSGCPLIKKYKPFR